MSQRLGKPNRHRGSTTERKKAKGCFGQSLGEKLYREYVETREHYKMRNFAFHYGVGGEKLREQLHSNPTQN